MSVKDSKSGKNEWRDVVMPGIGLYRIQAYRSGDYAGANEPEFGPDVTQTLSGVEVTFLSGVSTPSASEWQAGKS